MSSRFIDVVSYENISFLLKVPEFFYWIFMHPSPFFFVFYLLADHWVVSIIPISPHTPLLFPWAFGMNAAAALRKGWHTLSVQWISIAVTAAVTSLAMAGTGRGRPGRPLALFFLLEWGWRNMDRFFFFHVILPPWGKDNLATDLINRGMEKVTPATDDVCRLFCWFSQTHAIYCFHLYNTFIVNCPQKIHPAAIQCSTFNRGTK